MNRFVQAALALTALVLAAPASAGGAARTHDGLYLRPELGVGYLNTSTSDAGDIKFFGGGGEFSFAVGGAIKENLILAGHLYVTSVSEPDVEVNGVEGSTNDVTSSLVGFGPQLTYYFMPVNVYLSGTLALTRVTLDRDGASGSTEMGLGARLALGKEWWVSDGWGLGLAANFGLSSNEDKGENAPTWGSFSTGLTFSATFN